jgi:hypothetical protein
MPELWHCSQYLPHRKYSMSRFYYEGQQIELSEEIMAISSESSIKLVDAICGMNTEFIKLI